MIYRILLHLNFSSNFLIAYNSWATRGDSHLKQVGESEGSNYQGFVDIKEDDWGNINSGTFCRFPIQWFTEDEPDISFQEKLLPSSVIESGSISLNDDETREGTITISNGDGQWIEKRKVSEISIVEAGLDKDQKLSEMTLEEYRNRLEVIRFP